MPQDRTLEMSVDDIGFMLERLGQDCASLQFLRELTKNSIEAVLTLQDPTGTILWDVDWILNANDDVWKLALIDTGIGMTGQEMEQYINKLSSSVHEQSLQGNFGVGAKIAAATRNPQGLIYQSWKDGIGYMVWLWKDPVTKQYGLRQFERPDGSFGHWTYVTDDVKPELIGQHGTKVVLLGLNAEDDTVSAPATAKPPTKWVRRYLNDRLFAIPEGVDIRVREGWLAPRDDSNRNVTRRVIGQKTYLREHAESSGALALTGATAHWWILREEDALRWNSEIRSSGHTAALFQNELYETLPSNADTARLQQFGDIFASKRVVIYVEPHESAQSKVTANTARTQLLINSEPLPWADWATEFRQSLPQEIGNLIEEIAAGATSKDHEQEIRERINRIKELFEISRYQPTPTGQVQADPSAVGSDELPSQGERGDRGQGTEPRTRDRPGNSYLLFQASSGIPAEAQRLDRYPDVKWVSVLEGTRTPDLMEDRAASYLVDQNVLLINADFRVFADMELRWQKKLEDRAGAKSVVREEVHQWFEQQLVETVLGVLALKDGKMWTVEEVGKALSQEALTSAVMARFHVDAAIKKALGQRLGSLNV